MITDTDFRTLTERLLAEQLAASVAELEDHHTMDTLAALHPLVERIVKK